MKEEALGQIPKGYPLNFFVDDGKILENNQLRTNALELPGQSHVRPLLHLVYVLGDRRGRGAGGAKGGGGEGGMVIVLGAGCDGYDRCPCLFFY